MRKIANVIIWEHAMKVFKVWQVDIRQCDQRLTDLVSGTKQGYPDTFEVLCRFGSPVVVFSVLILLYELMFPT